MEKVFTEKQKQFVKDNWHNKQTWWIAEQLGLNKKQVSHIAERFGLKKDEDFVVIRKESHLTLEQCEFILQNYYNMSNKEICKQLNIPYEYLKSFASRRGLRKEYYARDSMFFSKEQIDYVKEQYPKNKTAIEIAEDLGIKESQVRQILLRHNIKKKKMSPFASNGNLTKYQKQYIIDNYSTMRSNDIARALGITYEQLKGYASNKGLKKDVYSSKEFSYGFELFYNERHNGEYCLNEYINNQCEPTIPQDMLYKSKYGKYYINRNYFSVIDNEWKAYWLGFLYADGYVRIKQKGCSNFTMGVSLAKTDYNHLVKLNNSLQSDYPIKEYNAKLNGKIYPVAKLGVYNQNIVEDLIDKGCVPNKSLILTFPTEEQVPKKFIRHFLRGYFDGDGCIHINIEKRTVRWLVLGTYEFLTMFKEILQTELNIDNMKISKNNNSQAFTLNCCGVANISLIYNYLYDDCNIYLDRKLEKFDTLYCLGQMKHE